jgi:hypothetical protein
MAVPAREGENFLALVLVAAAGIGGRGVNGMAEADGNP